MPKTKPKNPASRSEPEEEAAETERPPESDAPESDAPESDAPESDAPEFDAPEIDAPESDEAEAGGPEEEAPLESEAERAAILEAEAAELKDQLLRALAENENLRRRSQRQREEAVRYAAAPLVRDLLAVADNLRRALDSVPAGASAESETLKKLLDGLELTVRELQSVFTRHHIVKIDPLGERLDPHLHEAMFEIPDTESPAGTIVQVFQSGYLLHDRLLRPARVALAKGGPPATDKEAPDKEAPDKEAADDEADESPAAEPGRHVDTSA